MVLTECSAQMAKEAVAVHEETEDDEPYLETPALMQARRRLEQIQKGIEEKGQKQAHGESMSVAARLRAGGAKAGEAACYWCW